MSPVGSLRRALDACARWWKDFWFPASTGLRLAICRIVVVGGELLFLFPPLERHLKFVHYDYIDPQMFIMALSAVVPESIFPTAGSITFVYWATLVTGITTLIGLFTRTSAFLFALGNWTLIAHSYSYGEDHHAQAILCIFLLALAFSPSGRRLSLDSLIRRSGLVSRYRAGRASSQLTEMAMWPLQLVKVLLCVAYVSNGVAKLVYGGLAWMNGYTLQNILFTAGITRDLPLGVWLAQYHTLCVILSVGVILLETFFFLVLFVPKLVPIILLSAASMHIGIYYTEGAAFFHYLLLYVVFVPFERLLPWLEHAVQRWRDRLVEAPGRWAGVLWR